MSSWIKLIKELRIHPNKDDVKYNERDLRDREAGKKFADATGISKVMGIFIAWAEVNKKAFLAITFGFVLTLLVLQITRMVSAYNQGAAFPRTAVIERIDSILASPRQSVNN